MEGENNSFLYFYCITVDNHIFGHNMSRVENLATAYVLGLEADYVNRLRAQFDKAVANHADCQGMVFEELLKELERLNPKRHMADEEEILIALIEKRKRRGNTNISP